MGRQFLRHGFKLKDVLHAMTAPDNRGALHRPEMIDEFGKKYNTTNDALQAVCKGTTVMLIEYPHNGLSNMVSVGLHKDGNIALSPSKTINYEKTMDMLETVANPPSRGRRLAYNLFGRFAKNSFADVKKYNEQQVEQLRFINREVKPELRKHIDSDPIETVETMEDSTYSRTMASIDRTTEALRAKYKDYVPGVSPISVNFVAPEIVGFPEALMMHAEKESAAIFDDIDEGNYLDYYPGTEKFKPTKMQQDILRYGLQRRLSLYGDLAGGNLGAKLNTSDDRLPSVAAATYVHHALMNRDKDDRYYKVLSYLEKPENCEKFMNALTEAFEDTKLTVVDIFMLLETGRGAEMLLSKAEHAIEVLGPDIEAYKAEKASENAPAKSKTVTHTRNGAVLSWTEDEPAAEATKAEPYEVKREEGIPVTEGKQAEPNEVKQEERIPLEREHGIPLESDTRTRFDDDPEDYQEYTTVDLALMRKGGIAAEKIKEQLAASKGKACEFNTDDVADLIIGRVASLSAVNSEAPGLHDAHFAHIHLNGAEDNATFIKIFLKEELEREPLTESKLAKFMAEGGEKEMTKLVVKAIDAKEEYERQFANEQAAKAKAKVQKIQAEKKVDVEKEFDTAEMSAEYDELQVSGAAHNRMQLPINEIQISAGDNELQVRGNVHDRMQII